MKADRLNRWLTFGANIGLLAGLLLVAHEINQSRELVRADLGSQQLDRRFQVLALRQGDELSLALSKAKERPDDLTTKEIIQLENHLRMFVQELMFDWFLYDLEIFGRPPSRFIQIYVKEFFDNDFATNWWIRNRDGFSSELRPIMDEEIRKISDVRDRDSNN